MPSVATDLPSLGAQPYQVEPARITYPFAKNGDYTTSVLVRTFKQIATFYVPGRVGVDTDFVNGGDPNLYQVLPDSDPIPAPFGGTVTFTRTYARIPSTQTTYASRVVDRPVMHDINAGGYYAVSFDNGVTSHVFSARTTASLGAIDVPNLTLVANRGLLPGGITITVTGTAGTQTFSTSDTAATIRTNIQAAMGGTPAIKVTTDAYGISVDASGFVTLFTVSAASSSVKISGSATNFTIASADTSTASVRRVTTAIAAAVGQLIALWNGSKLVATGKVVATDGSSYSDMELDEVPGKDLVVTHAAVAGVTACTRYVNGSCDCSTQDVTAFYLPGVSSGISTPADIPLVAAKLDAVSWLTAIQAATTYVVCEGSQLSRWLDGPIYQQTTISVQMSDALDTVAVGA